MTDQEFLDHREALLEGVTPGPWETETDDDGDGVVYGYIGDGYPTVTHVRRLTDARHLAACDPASEGRLIALARRGLAAEAAAKAPWRGPIRPVTPETFAKAPTGITPAWPCYCGDATQCRQVECTCWCHL